MTLLDALPRDSRGLIEIPVGGVGKVVSAGWVQPSYIQSAFAAFADLNVPLTETVYQDLLDASTPNWKLNWQRFREDGTI